MFFSSADFFLDGGVLPPFEILAPLLHAARLLADVGAAAHGVGLARYFRRVRADLRVLDLVGPRARLPRGLLQTADLLFFSCAFCASSNASCRCRFSYHEEKLPFCTSMPPRLMDRMWSTQPSKNARSCETSRKPDFLARYRLTSARPVSSRWFVGSSMSRYRPSRAKKQRQQDLRLLAAGKCGKRAVQRVVRHE